MNPRMINSLSQNEQGRHTFLQISKSLQNKVVDIGTNTYGYTKSLPWPTFLFLTDAILCHLLWSLLRVDDCPGVVIRPI